MSTGTPEVAMSTGLRFTLEVDGLPPDAFVVRERSSEVHFLY